MHVTIRTHVTEDTERDAASCCSPALQIVAQGERAETFFLIETGSARVMAAAERPDGSVIGAPRYVRELQAGDYFGA